MPRPLPTLVYHFTHVTHLPTVIEHGLLSDAKARHAEMIQNEVGNHNVKARRRGRDVPVPPGGVVADYTPFYFAPRSPMMYVIDKGSVPTYDGGCDELVYLVTTVEDLAQLALDLVFTDRNAAMKLAEFVHGADHLDDLIDWPLMESERWHNTPEQPDRKERRMAECLVHGVVPWGAFREVVTKTAACADQVAEIMANLGARPTVDVRPSWYF